MQLYNFICQNKMYKNIFVNLYCIYTVFHIYSMPILYNVTNSFLTQLTYIIITYITYIILTIPIDIWLGSSLKV